MIEENCLDEVYISNSTDFFKIRKDALLLKSVKEFSLAKLRKVSNVRMTAAYRTIGNFIYFYFF